MSQNGAFLKLIEYMKTTRMVASIQSSLYWDQETYMPDQAIGHRSNQLAFLADHVHHRWVSDTFKSVLGNCVDLETGIIFDEYSSNKERCVLQHVYKEWKKITSLPESFMGRYAKLCAESTHMWQQAREQSNYALFEPFLKQVIDYSKERAERINDTIPLYDVMLDDFEPNVTTKQVETLFHDLKIGLGPLVQTLKTVPLSFKPFNDQFDAQRQWQYSLDLLKGMGFDFSKGRQDQSAHPFTIESHPFDVRVTTRIDNKNIFECITSTIHEGGHGLYEQGLNPNEFGTALGDSVSLGIHESQSRLWENHVCKSLPFWEGQWDQLYRLFPDALSGLSPMDLYKHVNVYKPGPIRVEADEVSYVFHVMIRFECEKALFDGTISSRELPDFWNTLYETYLGVKPKNDAEGVLQDMHWSDGSFGYFPTYVMGSIYAAQLFEALSQDIPNVESDICQSHWLPIKQWLAQHIFQYGSLYQPDELIKKVTGSTMNVSHYIHYLTDKYNRLYEL